MKIALFLLAFLPSTVFCIDVNDILKFLSLFGTQQVNIVPSYNNYYQDINEAGGGSYLGNLSRVNNEPFFTQTTILNYDTLGYSFQWLINEEIMTTKANPMISDFADIQCDGVVSFTLIITDESTGSTFERTEYGYLGFNYIEDCFCDGCPNQWEVFFPFFPDVPEYTYQASFGVYDFNQNNLYDINDLMILLSMFSEE